MHEEVYVSKKAEDKIIFTYSEPDCFVPEENNDYPLCVGNGSQKCEDCSLYAKLDYNKYE